MTEEFELKHYYWDHKKWHQYLIPNSENYTVKQIDEVIEWINNNIDMPRKHARWRITQDSGLQVKFRYERDLIFFKLRW